MAVYKQLKTKIDGKTTDIYPYTSPDAVLNSDGTTLQDTLDDLSDSVNNAVSDIKVDWNETDETSANYIHNKPDLIGDDYISTTEADSYIKFEHKESSYAPSTSYYTPAFGEYLTVIQNFSTDGAGHIIDKKYSEIRIPNNYVIGATSTTEGKSGLVPAPEVSDISKFLKGDGTWGTPTAEITKQDIIDALGYEPSAGESDNNTTYTLTKSGSAITLTGSDGSTTSVEDSDTDTTYSDATTSTSGLMSSADKAKLNSIPDSVITNTDPGVGTSVSYSDNTLIFVYEE